jgi:hypothetical protein
MITNYYYPLDPLTRFCDIYNALNVKRGLLGDASSLRFTAMSAVICEGEPAEIAAEIRRTAEEIKAESGWFGDLKSPLRFIVSAILVLNEDRAADFFDEVKRVRKVFRRLKLRRGGIYEEMAILIMRVKYNKTPLRDDIVERLKSIYEELKKYHWWLTGPEDYPICGLLAVQRESPEKIGTTLEQIYKALHKQGFSRGDPLQTAAGLLYFAHLDPELAAIRFRDLAACFRNQGVRIWQSDYDELAILSFLEHGPDYIVETVLRNRKEIESLRPKPDRSTTFNLATEITFLYLARLDKKFKEIVDVKGLLDMQAIINAQRAAAAGAAGAAGGG